MYMNKKISSFTIIVILLSLVLSGCNKTKNGGQTPDFPKHIISLSPASTEILFALDAKDQIAAVSDYSDYPPEALELPRTGGFDGKSLSIETILSFSPDFVYLTDTMHDFLIPSLKQFNIPYYVSKADSIQSVLTEIQEIGKLIGKENEATSLVSQMNSELESINRISDISVYYEVWNEPYMSAGSNSFITGIIAATGASNIFQDIQESYPMVSEETIIARNPQVILIPVSSGISAESVKNRNGWSSIPAVENNKIYIIDDNIFTRPGPRIIQAIKELEKLLSE